MKAKSPDVKNIFSRSLLSCPYLDLWKAYLNFIKDVSVPFRWAPPTPHAPEFQLLAMSSLKM